MTKGRPCEVLSNKEADKTFTLSLPWFI